MRFAIAKRESSNMKLLDPIYKLFQNEMPKVFEFKDNAKTVLEALNNEFICDMMNDAILKGNVTPK